MATDDLTPLFRHQPSPGARFGQGRILGWDASTFESAVEWNGVLLRDLPVLAGAEALTFQPGDDVVLIGWDQGGRRGGEDWAIWSRAILPGSTAAEQAIAFLASELAAALVDDIVANLLTSPAGQELAAFVFASRVHHDAIAGGVEVTGTSFQDLDSLEVTADITDAGKAIAILGADITTDNLEAGFMALAVSGANTQSAPAGDDGSTLYTINATGGSLSSSASKVVNFSGLNAGSTTFSARYAAGGSGNANIFDRSITLLAF